MFEINLHKIINNYHKEHLHLQLATGHLRLPKENQFTI